MGWTGEYQRQGGNFRSINNANFNSLTLPSIVPNGYAVDNPTKQCINLEIADTGKNGNFSSSSTKCDEIATLTAQLAAKTGGSGNCNNNSTPSTGNFHGLDPKGYCWTHGWKVRKGHSSSTCSKRKTGHNATASRENTKGGSDYNKVWTGE